MRKRCDVVNCPNGRGEAGETGSERGASWPSYHLLPRLEPRRSLWLDAVTFRSGRLKARRVCSLHFRPEDYTFDPVLSRSLGVDARAALNPDAVPSLLLGHEQQIAVCGARVAEERGVVASSGDTSPEPQQKLQPLLHVLHQGCPE
ncbi:hypothetical protein MRX96_032796 [Rhipicephalus microplus]